MSKASLEDYDPLTNFTERTTFLKLQLIAQNIQAGGTIVFRKIGEGGKKIVVASFTKMTYWVTP